MNKPVATSPEEVLRWFLELLVQNPDPHTAGGHFGNTFRDVHSLSLRLGVDPKTLSEDTGWQRYCANPF